MTAKARDELLLLAGKLEMEAAEAVKRGDFLFSGLLHASAQAHRTFASMLTPPPPQSPQP